MNQRIPVILQILPSLESGGVERGTIEIAAAIKAAGMKPIVASSGGALVPHVIHAGAEHITLPLKSKNPLKMWRNISALKALIQKHNVSIIHARSRAPAWSAYYAAKQTGIHFMTTFHGMYGVEGKFKKRYSGIMAQGERVIAISEFIRAYILEQFAIDENRIRVIPRGVDFSVFDEKRINPERLASLTKSWRLPDAHVPIIFCPGRISRIKGQHVLIGALTELKNRDFLCIIAGKDDGHEEYRHSLERQIIDGGLEGKVRLVDPTNAMNEAYMISELVVVPSIQPEAFGRIAIEAQAMGKAVIATDHGGARETIVPNETGYLVPPGDAKILADVIAFTLDRDEPTKNAMADYARAHVREHFTSDRMKDSTMAVYRELLGK
ncbi:MAG: hypothetical protein B7X02_02300 [Rhodospirillales bacterium 12-54-5]|nr:MAG: hypothetical protein B7X02_02300 [Rhodospirillales bacterium 12-54-5]